MVRRLVTSSGVGPGDLVLEFGAGTGVLTAALARTGARVIAVERSAGFADRLHRRFDGSEAVRVVVADARTVPLPRRPFAVVANIPYSISTELLRRLLSRQTAVTSVDLLVEWGFAKRVSAPAPRDEETAWWQARYEITMAGKVSRRSFTPAPGVDSAHLVIRPRKRTARATRRRGSPRI
ncbi:methyltransferase domain-containing protein [Phytoactinopolyspora alkaliphila]|uniref:Methyltransferase domain-containing protein n=1 Tax=Phytoactinopolyspora alkaliphila TaxID=1783498 RepID=A0A6N9YRK7_9ACTN|nr:methyltransferase domain-containing protein [Phytoactinopolyspora alkaliphila]